MVMAIETFVHSGSGTVTLYFDSAGRPIYPCRCGEVHDGDYGAYDFYHHECFHTEFPLVELAPHYLCCLSCGQSFRSKPFRSAA